MAGVFGPGGFGGGGMGGGGGLGARRHDAGQAAGLPFAGIPAELAETAERILATEPDHPAPDVAFTHRSDQPRRLTLTGLLAPRRTQLAVILALVIGETLSLLAGPALAQLGIDQGIIPRRADIIVLAGSLAVAAVLVTVVLGRARVARTGRLAADAMYDLRIRVFAQLQRLSLDFYTTEKAGVILTRMTSDIEALQQYLQDGLSQLAVQGLTMVVVLAILFTYDRVLVLVTVLAVVLPLLGLSDWFRRASNRGYTRVRDGIAGVLGHLAESLQGIRVIALYNRQDHDIVEHRDIVGRYRTANDYTASVAGFYGPSTELIGVLGQALVLAVGVGRVATGQLTIGELTAFLLYLNLLSQPVQQLVQVYNTYQSARAAVVKLRELLALAPSVPEAPDAVTLPPAQGRIELRGVGFAYVPDRPVLEDLDLHIAPGETVALVGPTGGGKSTVAKLVTRFYDPSSGSVRIDGHDLRTVTLASLRRQIGVVPQEPYLFGGTVRDNLRFARPDATDDELFDAVHRLGLDRLLDRLPAGLDTPIHERGTSLSAGERQLLALGRTFVARPRVVILDEATSNLDLEAERRVEAALDVLLDGRTAILIAHRLTTAERADRIIVVNDGGVVEHGPHAELVAAGGHYAELYAIWAAGTDGPAHRT